MTITDDDLNRWEKLANAATPVPWEPDEWYESDGRGWAAIGPLQVDENDQNEPDCPAHERAKLDAAFIAAARSAVPDLIAELRRLHGTPLVELYLKAGKERDDLRDSVRDLEGDLGTEKARVGALIAQRDALRAEVEAMWPVVEAARLYVRDWGPRAGDPDILAAVEDLDGALAAGKAGR